MNQVNIGSDNGLSPIRRQAITRTNADLLLIGRLEQTSVKYESKYKTFIHDAFVNDNAFGNIVCKITAILSGGRWMKEELNST